uniref:1,3-beta-glucan synthase n=1 Tax=Oryza barthii TaxID=65489 RepID=A0A0D3EPT4_9ORYZ
MATGGGGLSGPQPSLRRGLSRAFTMRPEGYSGEDGGEYSEESELVPNSLAPIVPILRAANEIEEENQRVAYLCRFTAFEKAHTMDPNSGGRGVRQFKTYLLHRLEKDEHETQRRLAGTDAKEIQRFYEHYCKKNLVDGLKTKKPEEMARHYQIASVLYDVLKTVTPEKFHAEFDIYAKEVEKEKASFSHYNILPLNISGQRQPVMEIPEIKAAVDLLRKIDGLPMPRLDPVSAEKETDVPTVRDLFDWLWLTFGFQKGNVENQKEHLILLLANIDMRKGANAYQSDRHNHVYGSQMHSDTVRSLMRKIFENYISWCRYLHLESNIKIPNDASTQQPEILYIGLYLLIWGEASNMARDLYDIISDRRQDFDPPFRREGSDDAFLQLVIQPIYSVMKQEAAMNKRGRTSHSKWRNYDDLNEYFWSKRCFKQLKWPMDSAADFFAVPLKIKTEEAMVIVAWSPSGLPSAIFDPTVFRNVLTIFITAAFLNFLQATLEIILNWKAWRSLECSQMIRYILKFIVAVAWLIILPTTYMSSIQNSTGLIKFFSSWIGNLQSESIYNFAVALYMLPNIFSALFFIFLPFRRVLERSNSRIIRFFLWWTQPKLYVARGMYEDTCSLLKYTLFWILLLICKLAFSFYVEHNLGVVITVWAPIVMIRTLGMLRSRFEAIPIAFGKHLVPGHDSQPKRHEHEEDKINKFSDIWNAFIHSLREEDLISNRVVDRIHDRIEDSIRRQSLRTDEDIEPIKTQIANLLQDIMEIITQDIMKNGQGILKDENRNNQLFANINLDSVKDKTWKEKCVRLQLLLTTKESAIYVPTNLDARRRITFFANSLFMKMPKAPQVRSMMSFSVLTPYFKEEVLFSAEDLYKKNEDGISILFYLRKIYPDEWKNFLERIEFQPTDEESLKTKMDEIRPWASYRGQTLTRTVRGMMYYRRALEIQCIQDKTDIVKLEHRRTVQSSQQGWASFDMARAIADIKFTYVVSCQVYGMQKTSKDPKDKACYLNILNLMYPSLRVAYIDEVEAPAGNGTTEKTYYSVLVKGGEKYDEEIYRIKLPGKPTDIGEGKPENQNHAIVFTRGEALQAIDMNQDNYLEEAFKMRNVLEEFESEKYGKRKPTILGLREHIFTGSVSSLAWFMSNQETSFVTIGQRVLANPLKVRFHYGHPDIFDRLFHITRGGISKASKTINLSEDIFSGFNSTMREGNVTHHEYMQVGKGRDVGMNQISSFEAKVANGNGEQTLSRDIYRLGRRFDFYRMLSFYFTTVGFYFSSMVTVLTVYVFLYGRLYLVMSGLERSILLDPRIEQNIKPLENALASQSFFQLGLLLVLPMVMEVGLEKGFRTALGEFVIMQLQLASVFFTFQLGTKTHYYGRTILHGGAKYRPTGRGFVVYHAKFADNYRMYSRSHFVKGLELLILLVVYLVYGSSYRSSSMYLFVTFSIWFLVASWLFAPFIFNPSCFEWQKTVDDWTDWRKWMGNRGGIGMSVDQSWEAWWISEQEHLRKTSIRSLLLEIILSLRFLIYQYGIVYHLNIARRSKSILVYGLSWLVMLSVLVVLKMVSIGRQKFGTDLQLMFRILKGLLFLGFVSVMAVLFVVCNLTISDVFASILGFMPTGWCILLIGQACSPLVKKAMLWDSIMELGRSYENLMGLVLFLPIGLLSWFPFVSEFQTRLLFNQAFSRGLQISRILAGQKDIGEE